MQEKIFRFNLDIKDLEFKTDFNLVQLDNTSRLIIKLYDNGDPYETQSNDKAEIAIDKNDNTFVVLNAELYNNTVDCLLNSNALASPGWTNCEVRILNEGKVLTSARFKIYIRENIVNNENIKSTSEYRALEELINEAKSMQESLKKGETVIEDVNKIKNDLTEIKESILNKSKEINNNLAVADEKINLIKTYISKSETAIENLTKNQNKIDNLSNLLKELNKIQLTLDELNKSINNANTQKTELNTSIESAKTEKSNLDVKIADGKLTATNLENKTSAAKTTQGQLEQANTAASNTRQFLEATTSAANEAKAKLDNSTRIGNSVSNDLSDNISQGSILNSNLATSISSANSAKRDLDGSISNAESTNTNLKSTDSEAKNTESLIRDLMNKLGKTKEEVQGIIASGNLDQYITDPKLQEALKSYATKEDLQSIDVTSQLGGYAKKTEIPTKLSQLNNDKTFKTEIEIQTMINNSAKLKKEVVTSLPSSGKENIIYLLKNKNETNNFYTEYLWIGGKWEIIGDTKVDLTDYAKKSDVPTKLSQLEEDPTHRIVTDEEKERWNKKFGEPEVNALIDQRVKEEARNSRPKIMTAVIDQANSNPLTCITYEDDAKMMEKGSAEWDKFFGTKLVLFKDGKEIRDLQDSELNNLKPKDGDVMVKFKRMGLNIKTVGDKVYVSMTDNPDDDNFKYYAHTRGTTRKEVFYLGAYLGFLDGNKLRSLTGKKPQDNMSLTDFRTYAQANGSGYDLCGFYQLTFLQAMYVLKYGNLDSQTAIGTGLTSGGQNATNTTGSINGKGIDYGTTSNTQQMRFQFIEDFYGNRLWAIDGVATDSSCVLYTAKDNFNSARNGYMNTGVSGPNAGGYVSKVYGTTALGFLGKEFSGSSTTFYSDYGNTKANYFLFFGGSSGASDYAGAFYCALVYGVSEATWGLAARLMYL